MKSKAERRERRRRILRSAIRLAHELFPEDEGERHAWLVRTIVDAIDIPLINERTEKKVISAMIELIEDLVD